MRREARLLFALAALSGVSSGASAASLFHEDFDGYSSFPAQDPFGDQVNPGRPSLAEGADSHWFAIRFETPTSGGSLDADLAVQRFGGGSNQTPVGRVEDEAGIAFNISTVGYGSATLDFDWRTFLVSGADRLRAGYLIGEIPAFDTSDYFDARGTSYAWTAWTPLLSGKGNAFQHATYALPTGVESLWVVFWLDNGEGDYGKVDNIDVTAVPEPATALLAALAVGAIGAARRARRMRSLAGQAALNAGRARAARPRG